jgi:hypothetical protein
MLEASSKRALSHRDLFVLGGLHKGAHDGGIFIRAVERLLDRKDLRIVRGAFNKRHDRLVRLVGMMKQNVPLANRVQ